MSDLDLMPRIKAAIEDAVIRRSLAEFEWPGCHKKGCRQHHGDIETVIGYVKDAVTQNIYLELLDRRVTEEEAWLAAFEAEEAEVYGSPPAD